MMYFGDKELVKQCMPSIRRILAFFDEHREESGLVSKIGGLNRIDRFWSFIDWADDWLPTTGMARCGLSGPNSLESLLYTMGLNAAAELADYIEESGLAKKCRHNAAAMRDAVRSNCFNEDGLLTDGPETNDLSQHAQVFGVLSGTFTDEEGRKAMKKCMTDPEFTRCTVAMNWYLFRALEETGLYHLTDRCWDVWRRMVANGCTTCVESEGYNRSECHAWGSLILYELPAVTLGVRPASPGYETVRVAPVPGYLDHAEGTVHTLRGDVRVAWHRNESGIECRIDADKGIHFSSNSVLR